MPVLASTHVEVYLFRRRGRRVEFLLLRRSPTRRTLPGVWQPVTGKRLPRERMLAAAMREVREETGLEPRRWWELETMTLYPDNARDAIMAVPLFAAEVDARATVRLSREHVALAWLGAREAARRVLWGSQRRGLDAVKREVLRGGPLAAALEITPPRPRSPRSKSR
jgi:dihydroneopterin triphosphate diphosphatase